MTTPFIPYEISNIAIQYSIPLIFISGLVSLIYKYKILALMQLTVYMTSILHWSHIEKYSMIRYLDMTAAIASFLYATYLATYVIPNIKWVWYYSMGISIGVFTINEFVFYIGIEYCDCFTYMAYQSVIIHMIFLHIMPTLTSMYCIIIGENLVK